MNRGLLMGIAIFFAVVGLALMGGDNQAVAGGGAGHGGCGVTVQACGGVPCQGVVVGCAGRVRHGLFHRARARCGGCAAYAPPACKGDPCAGVVACGGITCGGVPACHGLFGRRARMRRMACCGVVDCCGVVTKGGAVQKASPVQKADPVQKGDAVQKDAAQKVTMRHAPMVYYQISFRR